MVVVASMVQGGCIGTGSCQGDYIIKTTVSLTRHVGGMALTRMVSIRGQGKRGDR